MAEEDEIQILFQEAFYRLNKLPRKSLRDAIYADLAEYIISRNSAQSLPAGESPYPAS